VLLGQRGLPRRYLADKGQDYTIALLHEGLVHDFERPHPIPMAFDAALVLERRQVLMDGRRRPQAQGHADLPHRGRVPFVPDLAHEVIEDLPLTSGQLPLPHSV